MVKKNFRLTCVTFVYNSNEIKILYTKMIHLEYFDK